MKDLSVVIPCYNESRNLPELVARMAQALVEGGVDASAFELVLVENGSTDDSARVMAQLSCRPEYGFVRIVPIAVNQGYGYGMWQGLRATSGRLVATLHADLQCDPRDVFAAYRAHRSAGVRPTLVKGIRRGRRPTDAAISRGMEMMALLLLQTRLHEINAQPKLFDRHLVGALVDPPYDFRFDLYLVVRARELGFHFATIDVRFPPRRHGQSNWAYSFRSRMQTMLGFVRYMAAYRLRSLRARR